MFKLKSAQPKKGLFANKFKGFSKKGKLSKFAGSLKSGGISPSTDEFDSMLEGVYGMSKNKKSMFNKKKFN